MKVTIKKAFTAAAATFALVAGVVFMPVAPVAAQGVQSQIQAGIDGANPDTSQTPELFGAGSVFTTIVNIMLFIIGALSVIMLIYGGIRYTISGGDSSAVTSAKNTIMYSIIGLVVAFLAFAVVNWVLGSLGNVTT